MMKDKKIFEEPKLEIIGLLIQDVIICSNFNTEQQKNIDTPEAEINQ